MNRNDIINILKTSNTVTVLFMTGTNCKSCEIAKPIVRVQQQVHNCPIIFLDRERNPDIFSALKKYKQLVGVPTLLAYSSKNKTLFSDLSMSGSNRQDIIDFFEDVCLIT